MKKSSFTITSERINVRAYREGFTDPTCGAVVLFEGLVRNHHEGKDVTALSYEHHPIMAEPEGEKIIQEALQNFPISHAAVIHRVGDVPIGEEAVLSLAVSVHRAEAFAACQYLIDEVKHRVPIWKKETYTDGTTIYTEQCEGCSSRKHTHS